MKLFGNSLWPAQAAARTVEHGLSSLARALWPLVDTLEDTPGDEGRTPGWAPAPLSARRQRTKPPLGWPRKTDSLCPRCGKEARNAVVNGKLDYEEFLRAHPGEIPADIVERDGQIWMIKECPRHGRFEDVMAIDTAFLERIERLFPGRDFEAAPTELRRHGKSSIKYGRGSVLTVDLTNRCNMMCDPCFMDANQVGYVHELSWEEITRILDDAADVRPRRQMSIQFSGGEPTLSPHFLDAITYARKKGYFAVQCATNGIRFAEEPGFAMKAKEAGLR